MIHNDRLKSMIKNNIILVLLLLVICLGINLYRVQNISSLSNNLLPPEYHFCFIGQNSVDPYWKEMQQGVNDASQYYNVAVEFNAPRFNNPEEELEYLDMAILANVDGIITHVSSDIGSTELINRAYDKGIPVVTVENDNEKSNRHAFVGTNSYVLGKEAAKLLIEATGGTADIAVIVSSDYEPDAASQNVRLAGFLSAVKDYPNMRVEGVYTSKMGVLSAEVITQTLILNNPDINAILTTNSVDTLGAAQVIVNHNLVGDIVLVGYGDTDSILHFTRLGIIYGSVMSDPYLIGYKSLETMMDIKKDNYAPTFIDTGVIVKTMEDLVDVEYKAEPN